MDHKCRGRGNPSVVNHPGQSMDFLAGIETGRGLGTVACKRRDGISVIGTNQQGGTRGRWNTHFVLRQKRGSENRELGICVNKKFCKATSHENTFYLSSCFNIWCVLVRLPSLREHQSKSPFQKFLTLRPPRATCSQCQITRRGRCCVLDGNRESGETRFPAVQPTCAPLGKLRRRDVGGCPVV